jgi:hypothetical protein
VKFRWVLGAVFFDRLHWTTGYFCRRCRHREFFKAQALTLVFGWWGIVAMLVRNPVSIISNFKALVRPPLFAAEFGAIRLDAPSRSRAVAGALAGPRRSSRSGGEQGALPRPSMSKRPRPLPLRRPHRSAQALSASRTRLFSALLSPTSTTRPIAARHAAANSTCPREGTVASPARSSAQDRPALDAAGAHPGAHPHHQRQERLRCSGSGSSRACLENR